jgi:hypothetical protein
MNVPVDIKSAIICDDIRREDNGKMLFIGVYVGEILVAEFPIALRLTWVLFGKHQKTASHDMEFRISYDAHTEKPTSLQAKTTTDPALEDQAEVSLIIPNAVLTFQEPTALTVSVKEGGRWRDILTKKVVMLPPAAGPHVLSQPS